MKRKHPLLLAAILTLTLTPLARADRAGDEAALKARTAEFVAAWDRDDAKGMAAVFAPDADYINPFGRAAKGRAEIEKQFAEEHATFTKGTHFGITREAMRRLGTAAAIVDWDLELSNVKGPDGNPAPSVTMHVTVVYAKQDGKWWAVAARPAIPAPPPGAPMK